MDFIKVYTIVPEDTLIQFARVANDPDTINHICQRFRMNKAFIICPRTKPYYYIVNLNNTRADDGDKTFNLLMSNARYYSRPAGKGYFVVQFYLTSAPIGFNDQRPYYLETNKNRMQAILDFPLTGANSLQYASIVAYWTQAFNGQRYALYRAGQQIVTPLNEIVPYQGVQQYLTNLFPKLWLGPPDCYQSNTNENIVTSTTGHFTWTYTDNNGLATLKLTNNQNLLNLFYMVTPTFSHVTIAQNDLNSINPVANQIIGNITAEVDNPTFMSNDFTTDIFNQLKMQSGSIIAQDWLGYWGEIAPIQAAQHFAYCPIKRPIAVVRRVGQTSEFQVAGYMESFAWTLNGAIVQPILNPTRQDTIIPIEKFSWPSEKYSDARTILRMGENNICRDLRLETLHDINRVECFAFNLDQYSPYVSLILSGVRYVRAAGEDPDFPGYNDKNPIGTLLTEGTTIIEQSSSPPGIDIDIEILTTLNSRRRNEVGSFNFDLAPCSIFDTQVFDFKDKMYLYYNAFTRAQPTQQIYLHYVQQPLNKWQALNYTFDTFPSTVAPVIGQFANLVLQPNSPMRFWAQEAVTTPQSGVTIMVDYDRYLINAISKPDYILPSLLGKTAVFKTWTDEVIHYSGYLTPALIDMISLRNQSNVPPQTPVSLTIRTISQYNQTNRNMPVTHLSGGNLLNPSTTTYYGTVTFGMRPGDIVVLNNTGFNSNFTHYWLELPINSTYMKDFKGNQSFILDWNNEKPYSVYGPFFTQPFGNWNSENPNFAGTFKILYALVKADTNEALYIRRYGINNVNFNQGQEACYMGAMDFCSYVDRTNLNYAQPRKLIIWFEKTAAATGTNYPPLFAVKNCGITAQTLCNGLYYDTVSYQQNGMRDQYLRYSADAPWSIRWDLFETNRLVPYDNTVISSSVSTKFTAMFGSNVLYSTLFLVVPPPQFTLSGISKYTQGVPVTNPNTWEFQGFAFPGSEGPNPGYHTYYKNETMFLRSPNGYEERFIDFALDFTNNTTWSQNWSSRPPYSQTNCIFQKITLNLDTLIEQWGRIYWYLDNQFDANMEIQALATFSRSFSFGEYPFVETERAGGIYYHKPLDLRFRQTIVPGENWLVHIVKVTREVLCQVDDQPPIYINMRSLVESLPYAETYNLRDYGENYYVEYEIDGPVNMPEDLVPLRFEDIRANVPYTMQLNRQVNQVPLMYCDSVYDANGMNVSYTPDAGTTGGVNPTVGQPFPWISLPIQNVSANKIRYDYPTSGLNSRWQDGNRRRFSIGYPANICQYLYQRPRVGGTDRGFCINMPSLALTVQVYGISATNTITEIIQGSSNITAFQSNNFFTNFYPALKNTDVGGWECSTFLATTVKLIVIWDLSTHQPQPFKDFFETPPYIQFRQIPVFENPSRWAIAGRTNSVCSLQTAKAAFPSVQNNSADSNQLGLGENVFRGSPMFYTNLYNTTIPYNLNFVLNETWTGTTTLNFGSSTEPKFAVRFYRKNAELDVYNNFETCTQHSLQKSALSRTTENKQGSLTINRNYPSTNVTGNYFLCDITEVTNNNGIMTQNNQIFDKNTGEAITPYIDISTVFTNSNNWVFSETPWPFTGTNAPRFPRWFTMDYDKWHLGPSRVWVEISGTYNIILLNSTFTYQFVQITQELALQGENQLKYINAAEVKDSITTATTSIVESLTTGKRYLTFPVPQAAAANYRLETLINGDLQFSLLDWQKCYVWTAYTGSLQLAQNYLFLTKGLTNTDYSFQTLDTNDDLYMFNAFVEAKSASKILFFEQPVGAGPLGVGGLTMTVALYFYNSIALQLQLGLSTSVSTTSRTFQINPTAISIPANTDRLFVRFQVQNVLTRGPMVRWIMNMVIDEGVQGCTLLVCASNNQVLRIYDQAVAITDNPMSNTAIKFTNVNLDEKIIFYMNGAIVKYLQNPLSAQWSINCDSKVSFPSNTLQTVEPPIDVPAFDQDYNNLLLSTQLSALQHPFLYNTLLGETICKTVLQLTTVNSVSHLQNSLQIHIPSPITPIQFGNNIYQTAVNITSVSSTLPQNAGQTCNVDFTIKDTLMDNLRILYYKNWELQANNYRNLPTTENPQRFSRAQFSVTPVPEKGYIQSVETPSFLYNINEKNDGQYWGFGATDFQQPSAYYVIFAFEEGIEFYLQTVTRVDPTFNNMIDNLWVRTWEPFTGVLKSYPATAQGQFRYVYEITPIPIGKRLIVKIKQFSITLGTPLRWLCTRKSTNADAVNVVSNWPVPYNSPLSIDFTMCNYDTPNATIKQYVDQAVADNVNNKIIFQKISMPPPSGLIGPMQISAYAIISNNRVLFSQTPLIPWPYPDEINVPMVPYATGATVVYFDITFFNFSPGFPTNDQNPAQWQMIFRSSGTGKGGWGIKEENAGQNITYTLPPERVTSNYLSYLLQWSNTYTGPVKIKAFIGDADDRFIVQGIEMYANIPNLDPIERDTTGSVSSVYLDFDLRALWNPLKNWVFSFVILFEEPQFQVRTVAASRFISDPNFTIYDAIDNYVEVATPLTSQSWPFWVNVLLQHPNAEFFIKLDLLLYGGKRDYIWQQFKYISAVTAKRGDYAKISNQLVLCDAVDNYGYEGASWHLLYSRYNGEEHALWRKFVKKTIAGFLVSFNPLEVQWERRPTDPTIWDLNLTRYLTLYFK
jgi:hypothetical protein